MTYRRRHRWLRRLALGLAFATFVAPAAARPVDESGAGPGVVTAGGSTIEVIPYLSHGVLTEADQAAAAAEAIHDPYLTDLFVRPGESLGRPDGDAIAFKNALETRAAAEAEAIHDPYSTDVSPSILGEMVKSPRTTEPFIPGVTDFPKPTVVEEPQVVNYLSHGMAADGEVGARPDNRADRFAHSDVASRTELTSNGSSTDWNPVLTLGIGAVVLALALGLGSGYIKRPRLAGL